MLLLLLVTVALPAAAATRHCQISAVCQGTCVELTALLVAETDPATAPAIIAPIMDSVLLIADARLLPGDAVPPRIRTILEREYGPLPDNAVILTDGAIRVPPNGRGLSGAVRLGPPLFGMVRYYEAPDGTLDLISGAGLLQRTATGTCGDRS
ncbi:hypothetical protein [Actibacterium sp. 188UL27-1]|uniref:hypothetical protein n=1 Tax=Actibacterium sp. 188UL27-1 TaxID=2786961 RepID=UPI00195736A3|nr:hypothetical protein [Actibacterium sp. 188UL27-1]MBM7067595.1 hypothetical protein [Actibacterium sp. 188UL27-1]